MFFKSKSKIIKRASLNEESRGKKSHLSRVIFYFLIIIFGVVLVYVLIFSPFLRIKKTVIQGVEELEYEKVAQKTDFILNQKYLSLVERSNVLLINSNDLEATLRNDFKKISTVKVQKVFPDTIIISIQERKALLVWCSGGECFIVDENGFAYTLADFDSSEVVENNLIVVRDLSQSSVSPERRVINPDIIDFILAMRKEMKNRLDIDLEREFETPKSISGDLVAMTKDGWKIRLNKDLGATKEVEMLQLVLEQNIGEEQRLNLEYVDLRTENKVYYKFKNIDSEEITEEDKK